MLFRILKYMFWTFGFTLIIAGAFTPVAKETVEHAIDYFMENYVEEDYYYYDDYDDKDPSDYAYDDYDSE